MVQIELSEAYVGDRIHNLIPEEGCLSRLTWGEAWKKRVRSNNTTSYVNQTEPPWLEGCAACSDPGTKCTNCTCPSKLGWMAPQVRSYRRRAGHTRVAKVCLWDSETEPAAWNAWGIVPKECGLWGLSDQIKNLYYAQGTTVAPRYFWCSSCPQGVYRLTVAMRQIWKSVNYSAAAKRNRRSSVWVPNTQIKWYIDPRNKRVCPLRDKKAPQGRQHVGWSGSRWLCAPAAPAAYYSHQGRFFSSYYWILQDQLNQILNMDSDINVLKFSQVTAVNIQYWEPLIQKEE